MDNQQARFILQSYRPGGQDADDPHFTEALGEAGREPELAAWFSAERAFDTAIIRKLKQVPLPSGLRDSILAGRDAAVPVYTRRNVLFALAATIVLLGVVAVSFWPGPASPGDFAACRRELVASVSGPFELDFQSEKIAQVKQWLADRQAAPDFVVPAGLQLLPSLGCRTVRWEANSIALVCFLVKEGEAVHLFLIPRSAVPNPPAQATPEFVEVGEWLTASWTQGEVVYLFAGQGDEAKLRKYLGL